jgi:hypothetical protein
MDPEYYVQTIYPKLHDLARFLNLDKNLDVKETPSLNDCFDLIKIITPYWDCDTILFGRYSKGCQRYVEVKKCNNIDELNRQLDDLMSYIRGGKHSDYPDIVLLYNQINELYNKRDIFIENCKHDNEISRGALIFENIKLISFVIISIPCVLIGQIYMYVIK